MKFCLVLKKIFSWIGFNSIKDIICTLIFFITLIILIYVLSIVNNISFMVSQENFAEGVKNGKSFEHQFEYLSIMLGCITISLTLATVFPYFVTRFITARKVEEIIEDRVINSKNNILNKTIEAIFEERFPEKKADRLMRGDGDYARMTSYFLFNHKEYVWAIGWACRSLSRYHKCNERTVDSYTYREFENQCISTIVICISCYINDNFNIFNEANFENIKKLLFADNVESEKFSVVRRALSSLIDYRLIQIEYEEGLGVKYSIHGRFSETCEQKEIIDMFIVILSWIIPKKILDSECKYFSQYKENKKFYNVIKNTGFYNNGSFQASLSQEMAKKSRDYKIALDSCSLFCN